MTYYLAFLVGGSRALQKRCGSSMAGKAAKQALITGAVLLGGCRSAAIVPNAALIQPTLDYTPHTTRGEVLL